MLDAVVVGVGSGGTLTGLSRYFARVAPHVEMVLADPKGSVLADVVKTGKIQQPAGSWLVEGIGEDFVPPNCDLSRVRRAYADLRRRELLHRAQRCWPGKASWAARAPARWWPRRCATAASRARPSAWSRFVPDSGNKYLSKMYNDFWMFDQGLLERPRQGNLLDLIVRRYQEGGAVTLSPADTLLLAYRRMKLFDVSQIPVMQGEQRDRHRRRVGPGDAPAYRSGALSRIRSARAMVTQPGDHRAECADRRSAADLPARPRGDRRRARPLRRPDHAHRSAQLSAQAA